MKIQHIIVFRPDCDIFKDNSSDTSHVHLDDITIFYSQFRCFLHGAMQMSLRNDSKRSVDFTYRSDDFYVSQIFGISRYFDRRNHSQCKGITNTYLDLCTLSIWSNHSHLFYLSSFSDKCYYFFCSKLSRLSDVFEFFQFVSFAKKLLAICLGKMNVSIGDS
jgi:hypothetical protein